MANELRIQNGLYLDNFTNNVSAPNFLLIDGNGLVSYLGTGSLTIPNASNSSFPMESEGGAEDKNLWSTGPTSNLYYIKGSARSIIMGYLAGNVNGNSNIAIGYKAASGSVTPNGHNVAIGFEAGTSFEATSSIAIGSQAGRITGSKGSYSTYIGYRVASGSNFLGDNNLIIGTNITLQSGSINAINIGGLIFGTGSYSTTTGVPSSRPAGGKIGINVSNMSYNFQVSGTVGFPNLTNSSLPNIVSIETASGQLFFVSTAPSSSNIQGGRANYYTIWTGSTLLTSSRTLFENTNGNVSINKTFSNTLLDVFGNTTITGSFNLTGSNHTITGSLSFTSSTVTIVGTSASFVAPAPANVFHTNNNGVQTTTNAWRGAAAFFTPRKSGRMVAMCSGVHQGSSTANFTLYFSASTTAPPAGAAGGSTATAIGQSIQIENNTITPNKAPFAISGMFNATIGQQYFVDMIQGGSSVTSSAFNLSVFEL